MLFSDSIRLFWWNEIKLQKKKKENYGDLLGKYLVEKISKKKVVWVKPASFSIINFFRPIYVTVGSILSHVNSNCVVWGSGIISKKIDIKEAKFLAVRGPLTRKYLINLGYDVPEIYGDPALLLPMYYFPDIEKKFNLGIVPHYRDFKEVSKMYKNNKDVLIIDLMTNDIEETTNQFLKCKRIVSSSLHGIIVAQAYHIPGVWQRFSDRPFGDDIKFQDYFESVGISNYKPDIIDTELSVKELNRLFAGKESLPKTKTLNELCSKLMDVCPFKS